MNKIPYDEFNNIYISDEREMELRGFLQEFQKLEKELSDNNDLTIIEKNIKKNRCTQIKDIMLKEYMGQIRYFCKKFTRYNDYEDSLQDSIMYFFRAMKCFDPNGKVKFSTYVGNVIKNSIFRSEISRKQIHNFQYRYFKSVRKLNENGIESPTKIQIAKDMNMKYIDFMNLYSNSISTSLDEGVGDNKIALESFVADKVDLYDNHIEREKRDHLIAEMKRILKPYNFLCIYMHFYENKTMYEIAEELERSHQAVSAAIKKGLKKLKEKLPNSKYIELFTEKDEFINKK